MPAMQRWLDWEERLCLLRRVEALVIFRTYFLVFRNSCLLDATNITDNSIVDHGLLANPLKKTKKKPKLPPFYLKAGTLDLGPIRYSIRCEPDTNFIILRL